MTSLSTQSNDLSLDQPPSSTSSSDSVFQKPAYTAFPAFYTLQPNLTTRTRQLELWSLYITHYCNWHRVFRLSITSPPAQLTSNPSPPRTLKQADFRTILEHLSTSAGGNIIEWLPSAGSKSEQPTACWVWWRSAAEWAERVYEWVDGTGQKGTVLTVYELRESDAVRGQEWTQMDEEMFRKVLSMLVKKGKAQVFGADEGSGVKFF